MDNNTQFLTMDTPEPGVRATSSPESAPQGESMTLRGLLLKSRDLTSKFKLALHNGEESRAEALGAELLSLRSKYQDGFDQIESTYVQAGMASRLSEMNPRITPHGARRSMDISNSFPMAAGVSRSAQEGPSKFGLATSEEGADVAMQAEDGLRNYNAMLRAAGQDVETVWNVRNNKVQRDPEMRTADKFNIELDYATAAEKSGVVTRGVVNRFKTRVGAGILQYGADEMGVFASTLDAMKQVGSDPDFTARVARAKDYAVGSNNPMLLAELSTLDPAQMKAPVVAFGPKGTGKARPVTMERFNTVMEGEDTPEKLDFVTQLRNKVAGMEDGPAKENLKFAWENKWKVELDKPEVEGGLIGEQANAKSISHIKDPIEYEIKRLFGFGSEADAVTKAIIATLPSSTREKLTVGNLFGGRDYAQTLGAQDAEALAKGIDNLSEQIAKLPAGSKDATVQTEVRKRLLNTMGGLVSKMPPPKAGFAEGRARELLKIYDLTTGERNLGTSTGSSSTGPTSSAIPQYNQRWVDPAGKEIVYRIVGPGQGELPNGASIALGTDNKPAVQKKK